MFEVVYLSAVTVGACRVNALIYRMLVAAEDLVSLHPSAKTRLLDEIDLK